MFLLLPVSQTTILLNTLSVDRMALSMIKATQRLAVYYSTRSPTISPITGQMIAIPDQEVVLTCLDFREFQGIYLEHTKCQHTAKTPLLCQNLSLPFHIGTQSVIQTAQLTPGTLSRLTCLPHILQSRLFITAVQQKCTITIQLNFDHIISHMTMSMSTLMRVNLTGLPHSHTQMDCLRLHLFLLVRLILWFQAPGSPALTLSLSSPMKPCSVS